MKTLTLSLCAVLVSQAAWAADDTFTAEGVGQAAIIGGGAEKAFEDAKMAALRDAIEKGAGTIVSSDSLTQNSVLLRDRVMTNSQGYVKKYDVVSKKNEKNVVTVTVRAEIGKAELSKELAVVQALVKRMGKTKVIIVLSEQSIDDKGITTRSEVLSSVLTEYFRKDGWRIIDEKGTGEGGFKVQNATSVGATEAKEIAKKSDADYIVYGSVGMRYIPPQKSGTVLPEVNEKGEQVIFWITGEYDLQMFEVSTGRQLAKVSGKFDQTKMQAGMVKAMKSYSQTAHDVCKLDAPRIVSELRNPVLEYFRNQDVNGAEMRMKVSGLKDFGEVEDFEKAMESVANVRQVSANGDFEKGTQEYEVMYLGKPAELGKALLATTYKKKKLSVLSVKNNLLEVAIAK